MGFLDKMKNLFTEEVEEEEIKPQKKEIIKPVVETPVIKREVPAQKEIEVPVRESRLEENKEKFVFPVYFDDKDFDDLEKPKVKEKPKAVEPKEPKKEPYQGAKVNIEPEPKKVFKPSPIISPVYGVLDKNYSKEDITTKQTTNKTIVRNAKPTRVTVDDIRNKAYGTLEDDLENTLSYDFSEFEEKPKHEASNQEALDIFNELDFDTMEEPKNSVAFNELEKSILLETTEVDDDTEALARQLEEQKKKLEEISQYMSDNQTSIEEKKEHVDEIEEDEIVDDDMYDVSDDDIEEVVEEEVEEDSDSNSNLNDSELFDLIDSMYEKKDDE